MKARHKKAGGGAVYYTGKGSNVEKEADEKHAMKRGGRTKHMGKVSGKKAHHRLDKRARGGRTKGGSEASPMAPGSARAPFSSAAH